VGVTLLTVQHTKRSNNSVGLFTAVPARLGRTPSVLIGRQSEEKETVFLQELILYFFAYSASMERTLITVGFGNILVPYVLSSSKNQDGDCQNDELEATKRQSTNRCVHLLHTVYGYNAKRHAG